MKVDDVVWAMLAKNLSEAPGKDQWTRIVDTPEDPASIALYLVVIIGSGGRAHRKVHTHTLSG
jgi:hypothetical protein